MPMDVPAERAPESAPHASMSGLFEGSEPSILLDPAEAYDLHRAINERRAQVENPELLRRLRSL